MPKIKPGIFPLGTFTFAKYRHVINYLFFQEANKDLANRSIKGFFEQPGGPPGEITLKIGYIGTCVDESILYYRGGNFVAQFHAENGYFNVKLTRDCILVQRSSSSGEKACLGNERSWVLFPAIMIISDRTCRHFRATKSFDRRF